MRGGWSASTDIVSLGTVEVSRGRAVDLRCAGNGVACQSLARPGRVARLWPGQLFVWVLRWRSVGARQVERPAIVRVDPWRPERGPAGCRRTATNRSAGQPGCETTPIRGWHDVGGGLQARRRGEAVARGRAGAWRVRPPSVRGAVRPK